MLNNLSATQSQTLTIQDGDIWKSHFQNLYKDISPNELLSNYQTITGKLQEIESTIKNNQNPLDFQTTWDELMEKKKCLKTKKAWGPDSIKNEILKNKTPEMQDAVLKLFNIVLCSGCFPDIWYQGLISTMY